MSLPLESRITFSTISKSSKTNVIKKPQRENEWWENSSVIVANSKVSSIITRLMKSNIVRLADRNYMARLENAIEKYHNDEIESRTEERKANEMKRIQNLYFHKLDITVPSVIENHPVFKIRKRIHQEQLQQIKKLQEKYDKLKNIQRKPMDYLQQSESQFQRIKVNNRELEEKYKRENAVLGLNLLRIHDDHWVDCELDLKEFLKKEKESYFIHSKSKRKHQKRKYQKELLLQSNIKNQEKKLNQQNLRHFRSKSLRQDNQRKHKEKKKHKKSGKENDKFLNNLEYVTLEQDLDENSIDISPYDLLSESNKKNFQDKNITHSGYEDERIHELKASNNMQEFMQKMEELISAKKTTNTENI